MSYRVLTITAQYGAGGAEIASRIAAELGWNLLDRQLIDRIAALAHVPRELAASYDQQVDPWFRRLLRSVWRGGFEAVAATSSGAPFDCDHMAELTRIAIRESATIGNCVIVGRGGQCILRGRSDAFHVFIHAPLPQRALRVLSEVESRNEAEAAALADRIDQERVAFMRRYFNQDWYDPRLYDLMLNSRLGEESASAVVLCAMKLAGKRQSA